ncbi:MAG: dihydropteroate synthase [Abditibacteriota bacterium]|nr:dihydropteroate synthase [Abditibacteriota bacterium]
MPFWKCGRHQLRLGEKTYVMGIVNVTPDSFSGDGTMHDTSFVDATVARAMAMVEQGAHILDIGGESTRPGAQMVSVAAEIERVVPVVEALRARLEREKLPVPLSIDTTKAAVAQAALQAGADIINDISGATFDERMLDVLGASSCGVILMHLRGTPQTMDYSARIANGNDAFDVIDEILAFWRARVDAARAAGITDERIALDAGFGFGKSVEENLEILRRGRELSALGLPTLSATSRKSTIGKVLDDAPVAERVWGTAATVALAIANGCDMVRVHDVREMAQVARVADAIARKG